MEAVNLCGSAPGVERRGSARRRVARRSVAGRPSRRAHVPHVPHATHAVPRVTHAVPRDSRRSASAVTVRRHVTPLDCPRRSAPRLVYGHGEIITPQMSEPSFRKFKEPANCVNLY